MKILFCKYNSLSLNYTYLLPFISYLCSLSWFQNITFAESVIYDESNLQQTTKLDNTQNARKTASIKTEFELRLKGMMSKERECKPRYLILQDKLSISFRFYSL